MVSFLATFSRTGQRPLVSFTRRGVGVHVMMSDRVSASASNCRVVMVCRAPDRGQLRTLAVRAPYRSTAVHAHTTAAVPRGGVPRGGGRSGGQVRGSALSFRPVAARGAVFAAPGRAFMVIVAVALPGCGPGPGRQYLTLITIMDFRGPWVR